MSKKSPKDQAEGIGECPAAPEQRAESIRHLDRILAGLPPREPPPEDMPAIEKIKLYARAGYDMYHAGGDEDFERAWEGAFRKRGKFDDFFEARQEKGGEK